MPGPVSDSYDPEFGTREAAAEIDDALEEVYGRLTVVLDGREPIYIGDLVQGDLPDPIPATLTEKEWRLCRFAIERARATI